MKLMILGGVLLAIFLGLFIWRLLKSPTSQELTPLQLYKMLSSQLRWFFGISIGVLISLGIFLISFLIQILIVLQDIQNGINRILEGLR